LDAGKNPQIFTCNRQLSELFSGPEGELVPHPEQEPEPEAEPEPELEAELESVPEQKPKTDRNHILHDAVYTNRISGKDIRRDFNNINYDLKTR
jgi:hypothetical protein